MKSKLTIAITGHRDIVETEALKDEVKTYFLEQIANNKKDEITLLSPLADGADRLVAKIFLDLQKEHKELSLVVPMPFTQERYMLDFDEASKEEFLELLERADGGFQVPSMGDSPYQELGKYLVNVSDILLALWDGTFNGKAGGTGNVVEYAQHMNFVEVVHFVCERESSKNEK